MDNQQDTEKTKDVFVKWSTVVMKNKEQKWKNVTLKSLEARLRRFPKHQPPETLKAKLLAVIPRTQPQLAQKRQIKLQSRVWNFGAFTTAAAVILAFMFMLNYALSTPSQMLFTELDDTSLSYAASGPYRFEYDQNDVRLAMTLPNGLQPLMIKSGRN
jgi:hypothetical protein